MASFLFLVLALMTPIGFVFASYDLANGVSNDVDRLWKSKRKGVKGRIIGGSFIDISHTPYVISLQILKNGNWLHDCCGSIISPTIVLSAGHCVSNFPMRVKAGATAWQSGAGAVAAVASSYIHEQYFTDNNNLYMNDLSALFLASQLPIGGNIQILPLSPFGYPAQGSRAFVSGWGSTSCASSNQMSPHLKGVNVQVISPNRCAQIMRDMFHPGDSLCAGNPGRGTDEPYKGDSGSPLVHNGYQIGLVSAGHCISQNPHTVTVYSNIAYHRMWIKRVTGI